MYAWIFLLIQNPQVLELVDVKAHFHRNMAPLPVLSLVCHVSVHCPHNPSLHCE